jgi:4-hydroxy-tetrahydrodipicolinate reductase
MKIAIIGYGKMGKTIEQIAVAAGHEIVLTIDRQNQDQLTSSNLQAADVAIEFSRPETAFSNVSACLKAGVPVVSGTTAWLDQMDEAKAICEKENGAFFYASNFSIGVNIFFALSRQLAKLMNDHPEYDVRMEEIHHTQKLDYPSGTAITLAEGLVENLGRKKRWESELLKEPGQKPKAAKPDALQISSRREEGVPGTHVVSWISAIDTIEISHTAHSREGFAKGALAAAQWLVGRTGFFGMEDMLKG